MGDDLRKILRTTPRYVSILNNNRIFSIKDLLNYFPRTYENRSTLYTLDQLSNEINEKVSVKWYIEEKKVFFRNWKKIYDIRFIDNIWNTWWISIFNSSFLANKITKDQWFIIVWKPYIKYNKIVFSHPDIIPALSDKDEWIDWVKKNSVGRIYPVYPELNWIKPWRFANKIWDILPLVDSELKEYLPVEFLKEFNLMSVQDTIINMHYPADLDINRQAKHRVFFDRLLRIQLYSLVVKQRYQSEKKIVNSLVDWKIIKEILSIIPFELTNSQKKVLKDIIENLHDSKPMLRLLQWDVWSGKTVVAAIAAYYVRKKFKWQSVFLAPLEVLATQHYRSLAKLLLPLWMRLELLTGSLSKQQKDKIKRDLSEWKIHVIIWTHALLQDDVVFDNLQLSVIDEQHKFWVKQRSFFHKIWNPHILQMSATPIPRSMALAFFWEFDVSIIDELPSWRKIIHTKIISENEYKKLRPWILQKVQQGQKIFIVTPLIEESEKMEDLKAATIEYEEVKSLFPELVNKIGLLHWRMKPLEKNNIMNNFKWDKLDILVSTTVIEVWVDVPEATIMIIKNSERFGLSQLHQLRWRIWRNNLQSYCFLETPKKTWDSYKRLKSMEEISDWFKLAELDLQNRGAWEILGTMQSWETDIPLEILFNIDFLEEVKRWALWLLDKYPNLDWLWNLKSQLKDKVWWMLF